MNIFWNDILTMFNVKDLNTMSDALLVILGKLIIAILILVVSWLVVKIGNLIIHGIIVKGNKIKTSHQRDLTNFEGIFKTIFKWLVYIIAVLSIFTKVFCILDASSLITTVGVGGLAISIGAQSLISDIISGLFIMLENQIEVGDYITLGDIQGNVIELELRCMKLENYEGELVFIPYGEVRKLINKSKTQSSIVVDIPVNYKQDVNSILEIANETVNEYKNDTIDGKLEVLLPVSLDEKTYTIRIFGKCKPCYDWGIERDLRKMVVEKANSKNIKLGFDFGN